MKATRRRTRGGSASGIAAGPSAMRTAPAYTPLAGDGLEALRLGQLAQDDAALQRRQVIDEQHPIKMIDLVLDALGEETVRLELPHDVVFVPIADAHPLGPRHLGKLIRKREASF